MAELRTVVLSCDLCGSEDKTVATHSMSLDGSAAVEFEICGKDWERHLKSAAKLAKVGRKLPAKGRPRASLTAVAKAGMAPVAKPADVEPEFAAIFPGFEKWTFTAHSLERMGQRGITPAQACHAAESPTTSYPGTQEGTTIRINGRTKIVVADDTDTILTVARRNEEDEEALAAAS